MTNFLKFPLEINEDGWPPFILESLPVQVASAGYIVEKPPFFIKKISVGDSLCVEFDVKGNTSHWSHQHHSSNSTIWIVSDNDCGARTLISKMLALGCNIESLPDYYYHSIDIPGEVDIKDWQPLLDEFTDKHGSVAYPSFRHEELSNLD